MSATLQGARIRYRLRELREQVGAMTLSISLIASIDEALDDLVRLGDHGVDAAEILALTPYFGTLWPSGRGLARWLASRTGCVPGCLSGQVVLELGCGLALPSLVAARLGARVIATDRHPDVPELLARNAARAEVEVEYQALDWRRSDELGALRERCGPFDLVLASDLLYEAELATTLGPALARLSGSRTQVLLVDPGRPHLQEAADVIAASGFRYGVEVSSVPASLDAAVHGAAGEATQDLFMLALTRA